METRCKEEAYDEVISLLDSLQGEPVSEELEEEWGKNQAKVEIQAQSMALAHGCPE